MAQTGRADNINSRVGYIRAQSLNNEVREHPHSIHLLFFFHVKFWINNTASFCKALLQQVKSKALAWYWLINSQVELLALAAWFLLMVFTLKHERWADWVDNPLKCTFKMKCGAFKLPLLWKETKNGPQCSTNHMLWLLGICGRLVYSIPCFLQVHQFQSPCSVLGKSVCL